MDRPFEESDESDLPDLDLGPVNRSSEDTQHAPPSLGEVHRRRLHCRASLIDMDKKPYKRRSSLDVVPLPPSLAPFVSEKERRKVLLAVWNDGKTPVFSTTKDGITYWVLLKDDEGKNVWTECVARACPRCIQKKLPCIVPAGNTKTCGQCAPRNRPCGLYLCSRDDADGQLKPYICYKLGLLNRNGTYWQPENIGRLKSGLKRHLRGVDSDADSTDDNDGASSKSGSVTHATTSAHPLMADGNLAQPFPQYVRPNYPTQDDIDYAEDRIEWLRQDMKRTMTDLDVMKKEVSSFACYPSSFAPPCSA